MNKTKSIEKVALPDGRYQASWCSDIVSIQLPDNTVHNVKVNRAVRTLCYHTVEIKEGWLYIN